MERNRMNFIELNKNEVNEIVTALKWHANTFKAAAKLIDDQGNVCLSSEQKKIIRSLPESIQEKAKNSLLKENMWQEECYRKTIDLAKSIERNKIFIKK
nr:MAG TPA: hypothetical protein [Caudoviricetes sp.]